MTNFNAFCGKCSKEIPYGKMVESLNKAVSGMLQVRGECPFCKAWVKWVPYKESHLVKKILNGWYDENC